ncbi:MAG: hypothetical protein JNL26_13710 [Gemmatimonadetes bacterium]|nr:hypothetical protein [Gemmatimonadota bacterium]
MPAPKALLLACTTLLGACARDPHLVEWQVPDTRLVVQMPQPVTTTSKTVAVGGVEVVGVAHVVTFDDVEYLVVQQAIPPAVQEQLKQRWIHDRLDAARDELVASTRGTVQREVGAGLPTPEASFLGREVTVLLPGGRRQMIARLLPTNDVYFQIVVTMPAEPSYEQRLYATRFLESGRLR